MKRLHQLIQGHSADLLAVVDHDKREFSYGDLEKLSDQMAEKLAAHGVRGGDRVILLAENSATYVVAILALSKLDAWNILINARATDAEIERVMNAAGVRCIIYTPEASLNTNAHIETFGGEDLGTLDSGQLLVSPVRDVEVEPVEPGDEQVCAMFYTTGTTGAPKGVMLTHANLLFMGQTSGKLRTISVTDQLLNVLPGTHVFAFGASLLSILSKGASIRMMPRFDPAVVLEAIQEGPTLFSAVPQMYALLLKQLKMTGASTVKNNLRYLSSGGSPLDPAWKGAIQQAFGCHLHNGYGMTEASPIIAATRLGETREDVSVGRPLDEIEVVLHDPDSEGVGEVWVRGQNVMKGYYRNPEATAEAITEDGFLRTGDLAKQDPDGALHLVGRSKELIIHSGFNIYPAEVESALNSHAAVVQSAVVGRPRNGNEDVLAFVTLRESVSSQELRGWVRNLLAPYKTPLHIVVVEALPQAATGKILKKNLITTFAAQLSEQDSKLDA